MAGSVGQYTQGWFPWMGEYSKVGTWLRGVNNSVFGMGYYYNTSAAQNDERVVNLYLDSVTWKFAMIAYKDNTRGISTIQLDGVSQGTIDWYNATDIGSNYAEITNIAVATPGVKAYKMIAATKNAASSGYAINASSDAWIRTGGTASTPGGTDTPGYTWQWIPWMGYKSAIGITYRAQNSGFISGGEIQGDAVQNDEITWDMWLDAGTYKYAHHHRTNAGVGIFSIQLNGVEKGTIDGYDAGDTFNVYAEVTGIVVTAGTKTFKLKMATKNASASGYNVRVHSVAWIRTGA